MNKNLRAGIWRTDDDTGGRRCRRYGVICATPGLLCATFYLCRRVCVAGWRLHTGANWFSSCFSYMASYVFHIFHIYSYIFEYIWNIFIYDDIMYHHCFSSYGQVMKAVDFYFATNVL